MTLNIPFIESVRRSAVARTEKSSRPEQISDVCQYFRLHLT